MPLGRVRGLFTRFQRERGRKRRPAGRLAGRCSRACVLGRPRCSCCRLGCFASAMRRRLCGCWMMVKTLRELLQRGLCPLSEAAPAAAAAAPSPRQLARRARRKRQRARRREATSNDSTNTMYASGAGAGTARGVLPSDDLEDGGMTDAPQVVAPRAAAAAGATASGRACNKRAAAAASSAQSPALLTLRGPGDQGAAAPGAAASTDLPRKRAKGAGGGSAGEPAQAHGPRVLQDELSSMIVSFG